MDRLLVEGKLRRPMTDAERRVLAEHHREAMGDHQRAFDALAWLTSVPGMGTVTVLLIGFFTLRSGFQAGSGTACMLAVLYGAFALVVRKPVSLFRQMLDEMRQDLEKGEVEVQPFEALSVITVTSQDEADLPSKVFEIGGGKLLHLEASDLINLAGGGPGPFASFDLVEAPVSRTTLGIVPRGERTLEPERVIGPLDARQKAALDRKGRLFEAPLPDLSK